MIIIRFLWQKVQKIYHKILYLPEREHDLNLNKKSARELIRKYFYLCLFVNIQIVFVNFQQNINFYLMLLN